MGDHKLGKKLDAIVYKAGGQRKGYVGMAEVQGLLREIVH